METLWEKKKKKSSIFSNYNILLIKQLSDPKNCHTFVDKIKYFFTTQNASARFLEIFYVNPWSSPHKDR